MLVLLMVLSVSSLLDVPILQAGSCIFTGETSIKYAPGPGTKFAPGCSCLTLYLIPIAPPTVPF